MAVISDVFGLLLGVPASARLAYRRAHHQGHRDEAKTPPERTLLYGAGWAGVIVAKAALGDPEAGVLPVGFLDDDRRLKGSSAADLPILGDLSEMAAARRRTGASSLLITLPYSPGTDIRRVVDAATRHGLTVRTVPAMTELLDGTIDARQARPLRIEDLLRGPASAPSPALQAVIEGATVMIAGAGGRIGSQLTRRLPALKPGRIVLVDSDEDSLGIVADELQRAHRVARGSTSVSTHQVDVSERDAVRELIRRTAPSIILHGATLLETTGAERSTADVMRVNVVGTRSLVGAAVDDRVERFVLVSPDGALDHASIASLSLRVAEMVVSDAARRTGRGFSSVRVGRLADADQDALEAVRSQLERGQPVRVDASRRCHAMTIAEASGLILEAAAASGPGSVYRLDQGPPVRAADLTRDILRLLGRDVDRVPIQIVGPPPKDEPPRWRSTTPPTGPGLLRFEALRPMPVTFEADVERFLALAGDGHGDRLRAELGRYVRFIESTDTPYHDETGHRPVVAVPVAASSEGPRHRPIEVGRPRRRAVASRSNEVTPPATVVRTLGPDTR